MHVGGIGTLEKRGPNTWRIRLAVGRDPATGKYRQKSRTVHGTKADALRAREELRRELEEGPASRARNLTFGQFAKEFMADRSSSGQFRASTLTADRMFIRRLDQYLGPCPLTSVDAATIMHVQRRMVEDGYSQTMLHGTLGKLRQILKQAYRLDLLPANPCDKLDIPRLPERNLATLDAAGARRLLETLRASDQSVAANRKLGADRVLLERSRLIACQLALCTGMRRGEALGLTWEHVDAERGVLRIVQQFTSENILCSPKTRSGIRTVSLDEGLRDRLQSWKRDQERYLEWLGLECTPRTPVACNSLGEFQNAGNFTEWWADFREHNGFSGLRFHDLRHTQATLLIGNGIDIKTVQGRLGHSRAATTLDIYARALPENDRKAAAVLGNLLAEDPSLARE